MSPKNNMILTRKLGEGGPIKKDLQPTDLSVAPFLEKALLKIFCYGVILFIGLVDLNQVLISTKSNNLYSCYNMHSLFPTQ